MSQSLRLSEKWFRRGLWLVALIFGAFLTGLGSAIVDDLPKVERHVQLADFMDRNATTRARDQLKQARQAREDAAQALEQARLAHSRAQADNQAARETFNNWLSTRHATARPEQDPQLVERTQALDGLKQREREALSVVETQQQAELDARQRENQLQQQLNDLERDAQSGWQAASRQQELRVFLYRLALTLPLLVLAGWLFVKQRKSSAWPFVWGFIGFALVAFFVELVPYLPSYGGYVRYGVGIAVTVLVGRYAIEALNRYLAAQQAAEAEPDQRRRETLDYDQALGRLAKSVCPGCERPVDLKLPGLDFCPHCGIGLHDHCGQCHTRKNAWVRYCISCGAPARSPHADERAQA